MHTLQLIALTAATLTMGLMAGVFLVYTLAVMPGLRRTDDRTMIGAFQQIDTALERLPFVPVVGGALLFPALASVLHLGADDRSVLPWTAFALVPYLVAMAITSRIHLPRNHELRGAGQPDEVADLVAARARFDEARWIAWNRVRLALTSAAFGLLVWSLVLRGRIDAGV